MAAWVATDDSMCECGEPIEPGMWLVWDSESSVAIHAECAEFDHRAAAVDFFKSQGMGDREVFEAIEGMPYPPEAI